jgi:predicted nuclease of restriction endonuclease-like (RecB) superfamily
MLSGVVGLLEYARRTSARVVNSIMTATYWEVGRRIVTYEQGGSKRAEYGTALIRKMSADLTAKFGRGFGFVNMTQMRKFYLVWPYEKIVQTVSEQSQNAHETAIIQTVYEQSYLLDIARYFPLPWSHYVRLLSVKNEESRAFYEKEALRGGWSERQLDRQISSLFYERAAASKNKSDLLKKGEKPCDSDEATPEEEFKHPLVLEFLGLKDEYSETDLEEAIIHHLETFLLELGTDFAFVGRQKRLRIDDSWYRVDLVFFHRKLRSLFLIDLKLGKLTHADAGQMHMYLNYANENWTNSEENPPVGLILCAEKGHDMAKYALGNLPNKIVAAEYMTILPDEKLLIAEINKTRRIIEKRKKDKWARMQKKG